MNNLEITIKKENDNQYVVDTNNQDVQVLELVRILNKCMEKMCDNRIKLIRIPQLKLKKNISLKQYKKVLEALASWDM